MTLAQLYIEINNHLMNDEMPSQYFNQIYNNPLFNQYPFSMLYKLKQTNQSPIHHPEGNVWNHAMLVIDEAAKLKHKSKEQHIFMWAALLHDIGKPDATKNKNGRITSYDHDKIGAVLAKKFLDEFTDDSQFIDGVVALVRWHMQILFVVKGLPFADISGIKKQADIEEVALLGLCDRLGRTNVDILQEEENIATFIQKCKSTLD